MAGDQNGDNAHLSPELESLIDKAAETIAPEVSKIQQKSIIPRPALTRSDVEVSHICSSADLVRLCHAANTGGLSGWVQLFLGGGIASAIPSILAIKKANAEPPSGSNAPSGLLALDGVDILNLMVFAVCVIVALVLGFVWWRSTETVDSIVKEIKARPQVDPH